MRPVENAKAVACAYLSPGGTSNWTESSLEGMVTAVEACRQFDGLACSARALSNLIMMDRQVGKFVCHRDRKTIIVSHEALKEIYIFSPSQIEDFMGNVSMLAAQDCLPAIIWPYKDYSLAMEHFVMAYRAHHQRIVLLQVYCGCCSCVEAASCCLVRTFGYNVRRNGDAAKLVT